MRRRAKDEELTSASIDTFNAVAFELLTRESPNDPTDRRFCRGFCCEPLKDRSPVFGDDLLRILRVL